MSSRDALHAWLKSHRPDVAELLDGVSAFEEWRVLNAASGLRVSMLEPMEHASRLFLEAFMRDAA